MTKAQIQVFNQKHMVTYTPTEFKFSNDKKYGFFDAFPDSDELKKSNRYC